MPRQRVAERLGCWLLMVGALLGWIAPRAAHAQTGVRALPAVWLAPRLTPVASHTLSLGADVGYGVMGAVAGTSGAHQRVAGGLGVAYRAPFGLSLELRVDGRWDLHPGKDDSLVGDPRLFVRYAHALGQRARLGLEAVVWVPGASAPSLDLSATSVDVLALADVALMEMLHLIVALGPRFDRSARSVSPGLELSQSDQLSLGVSSYHALLTRVALEARLGETHAGLELSADSLLGAGAPDFRDSPLRAALVARHPLGAGFEGVVTLAVLLSARPELIAGGPYAPFEPRFSAFLGARYQYGDRAARTAVAAARPSAAASPVAAPAPAPPAPAVNAGSIEVQVENPAAEPLPDVLVALEGGAALRTGGKGSVRFEPIDAGEYTLHVSADGFEPQALPAALQAGASLALRVTLQLAQQESTLRVLVRDAETGAPLVAQLSLRPAGGRAKPMQASTAADGSFERGLSAGRYRVSLQAPGYQGQTRVIEVAERGVTLLNADLGKVSR
ncbi:MAG TPA: carboxypeptidase-like regulatory domain-containing protein [Polyangiales bacterium]